VHLRVSLLGRDSGSWKGFFLLRKEDKVCIVVLEVVRLKWLKFSNGISLASDEVRVRILWVLPDEILEASLTHLKMTGGRKLVVSIKYNIRIRFVLMHCGWSDLHFLGRPCHFLGHPCGKTFQFILKLVHRSCDILLQEFPFN
jgi:hypothetical protein